MEIYMHVSRFATVVVLGLAASALIAGCSRNESEPSPEQTAWPRMEKGQAIRVVPAVNHGGRENLWQQRARISLFPFAARGRSHEGVAYAKPPPSAFSRWISLFPFAAKGLLPHRGGC
jgi:hypothetical protein